MFQVWAIAQERRMFLRAGHRFAELNVSNSICPIQVDRWQII